LSAGMPTPLGRERSQRWSMTASAARPRSLVPRPRPRSAGASPACSRQATGGPSPSRQPGAV
jgi:hypothetical protein